MICDELLSGLILCTLIFYNFKDWVKKEEIENILIKFCSEKDILKYWSIVNRKKI
jgi:hypothetical protein